MRTYWGHKEKPKKSIRRMRAVLTSARWEPDSQRERERNGKTISNKFGIVEKHKMHSTCERKR